MNPTQEITDKRKNSDPKGANNLKLNGKIDSKTFSLSPQNLHKKFTFPKEMELKTNFCLSFKEIYFFHVKEIERKKRIKIKYIYIFFIIAIIFFMLGYFELIFSYIITAYYPILWTREDYKLNKDYFWKKWGTYWSFFSFFILFDLHKKEVLKLIPFYFIIKCVILLILYLPGFTVAVDIYDGLLKELLHNLGKNFLNRDDNDTLVNDYKKIMKVKKE